MNKLVQLDRTEHGEDHLTVTFNGQRHKVNLSAEHVAETLLVTMRKWANDAFTEPPDAIDNTGKKLHELSGGDFVVVSSYHRKRLAVIDRTTPTQIVIGSVRYNRKTGCLCGDRGWDSPSLRVATNADIIEITRQERIDRLCSLKPDMLKHLSNEDLCLLFRLSIP